MGVVHWVTIGYRASGCGALGYCKFANIFSAKEARSLLCGVLPPYREDEAARMLESMYDLLQRKQKLMTVDFHQRVEDSEREGEGEVGVFKKPRAVRRLTKKEISSPCNFKHVSGECGRVRGEDVRCDGVGGDGVKCDCGAGYCRDYDAADSEL